MSDLIISVPKLQTLKKRLASTLITLVFWALWLYLWLPLVTLTGWILGIDSVYFQMVELTGYRTVLNKFGEFCAVIAILGAALSGWALYNYVRFKGVDYRKPCRMVSDGELCDFFKVKEENLAAAKSSSFITVLFSEQGEIEELSPLPAPAISPRPRGRVGKVKPELIV